MGDNISGKEKLALICEDLQETLKLDIIEDVILRQNRPVRIYWGTATTGRPHCGYFVPMVKIAQFLRAGCNVKILLADLHGFLDSAKAPLELVEHRVKYYEFLITSLLKAVNVPIERLQFVKGSSYQLTANFNKDMMRLYNVVTDHDAKKAGAEVVKQADHPLLSGLVYPVMQALDEEYLDVDAQFGGVDQRGIFTLAMEILPKVGYKERAHLMNPLVPSLGEEGKMSSSEPDSKIDLLDDAEAVKRKIRKAYAVPKDWKRNGKPIGIVSFVEHVLLPLSALKIGGKRELVIERREGEGEPLVYEDMKSLTTDYENDVVSPLVASKSMPSANV